MNKLDHVSQIAVATHTSTLESRMNVNKRPSVIVLIPGARHKRRVWGE